MGGIEGVAAAMQPRDGEPPTAYINAATACGLQTIGAPGPGMPAPNGMNGTELLTSELSGAELFYLSETGDPQQLLMRARMRSPRRTVSRCSAEKIADPRSAVALRFVDRFRPLSLLIPLCPGMFSARTRRGSRPRLPKPAPSSVVDENAVRNLPGGGALMHSLTASGGNGPRRDVRDRDWNSVGRGCKLLHSALQRGKQAPTRT